MIRCQSDEGLTNHGDYLIINFNKSKFRVAGDIAGRPMIIADADLKTIERDDSQYMAILACDGVADALSEQQIYDTVRCYVKKTGVDGGWSFRIWVSYWVTLSLTLPFSLLSTDISISPPFLSFFSFFLLSLLSPLALSLSLSLSLALSLYDSPVFQVATVCQRRCAWRPKRRVRVTTSVWFSCSFARPKISGSCLAARS